MSRITKVETAAKKIALAERKRHGFGPVCCTPRIAQIVKMERQDIAELYSNVIGPYDLDDSFYPANNARTACFVDHSYC